MNTFTVIGPASSPDSSRASVGKYLIRLPSSSTARTCAPSRAPFPFIPANSRSLAVTHDAVTSADSAALAFAASMYSRTPTFPNIRDAAFSAVWRFLAL